MKNASPEEIATARAHVEEHRKILEEARTHADCADLVALLEERLAPAAEVLENAHQRAELLDAAHRADALAKQQLHDAHAVPCSDDRAVALERRDSIDFATQLVVLRGQQLDRACSAQESPFGAIGSIMRNNNARSAAASAARAIVDHVLVATNAAPGTDRHKADAEQAVWENLMFHREIARITARKPEVLRFADEAGVARAVKAVRGAFDARIAARVSREDWDAEIQARRDAEQACMQQYAADVQEGRRSPTAYGSAPNSVGWRSL